MPLQDPWGICADRVFVTEHYIAAISVFTLEGNRISTCYFNHTKSITKSNLSFPSGIAVGKMAISISVMSRITEYLYSRTMSTDSTNSLGPA